MYNPELTVVNEASLAAGLTKKEKIIMRSSNIWQKVLVTTVEPEEKNFVLQTLMDAVRPHDFLPVRYELEGELTVSFLLKNCGEALMEFYQLNLAVPNPNQIEPFRLQIHLNAKPSSFHLNVTDNVSTVLKKRYTPAKKELNLTSFSDDEALIEFSPLSQQRMLRRVLSLARNFEVQDLRLADNGIESLKPLEVLQGAKLWINLQSLNLKNNKIKSAEELSVLTTTKIHTLNLDGNPLCNDYQKFEYLKTVWQYVPNVNKLDGFAVSHEDLIPSRKGFSCSQHGQDFVDKFLKHYFKLYDKNRAILGTMYHKDATFSLTQHLIDSQTSQTASLQGYKKFSRNLMLVTNSLERNRMLFVGPYDIIGVLTSLPATRHDPYSFSVDLTHFEESLTVINVSGIFRHPKDPSTNNAEPVYNFMRTFVLTSVEAGQYKIINELLSVTNGTDYALLKVERQYQETDPSCIEVPVPTNDRGREKLIEGFMALTRMRWPWAKKCLEEGGYDMKASVILFLQLYRGEKLPGHAFDSSSPCLESPEPPEAALAGSPAREVNENGVDFIPRKSTSDGPAEEFPGTPDKHNSRNLKDIKDQVILDALIMPQYITRQKVRARLEVAYRRVAKHHKGNSWLFKLIGLEMYKRDLIADVDVLLAEAKRVLEQKQFEDLSLSFFLYQVEYDKTIAVDKIIRGGINTFAVITILEYIIKEGLNTNISISRLVLRRMAHYRLTFSTVKTVRIANREFEALYGTGETAEEFNRLDAQLTADALVDDDLSCIYRFPCKTAIYTILRSSKFIRFRNSLLHRVGVYTDLIDDPSVSSIAGYTGDDDIALIRLCDAAIDLYKHRFAVVKIVCAKFWERRLYENVRYLLADAKEYSDEALLQNLIIFYKIKSDIQQKKHEEIYEKLSLHVNAATKEQMLNFFEDLSHEDDDFISHIFENCLTDASISPAKKLLITFQYKVYGLRYEHRTKRMNRMYNFDKKWYPEYRTILPEELLNRITQRPDPFEVSKDTLHDDAITYLFGKTYTFEDSLHVMTILYKNGLRQSALSVRNCTFKKFAEWKAKCLEFGVMAALLEARYGETAHAVAQLQQVEDTLEPSINCACALAECYLMEGKKEEASKLLEPYLDDATYTANLNVQELLYKLYTSWKAKFAFDLLKLPGAEADGRKRVRPKKKLSLT